MIVQTLSKNQLKQMRAIFRVRGRKSDCSKQTGLSRSTIDNVLRHGTGWDVTIAKIGAYVSLRANGWQTANNLLTIKSKNNE